MKNLLIISLSILFFACQKQITPVYEESNTEHKDFSGIYFINEGNFGFGNGSISKYDPEQREVHHHIFQSQNNIPLGDVPQSINIYKDKFYIPVNSSGSIVICDTNNLDHIYTIEETGSPRFIEPFKDSLALITDLYSNSIHLYNIITYQKIEDFKIPSWTETMVRFENKIFISAPNAQYLYIFDIENLVISDSILLDYGIKGIIQDKNQKLWTLHASNYKHESTNKLYKINPWLLDIDTTIILSDSLRYNHLTYAQNQHSIYLNHAGQIEKYNIEEDKILETNFYSPNIYSFSFDQNKNELYLSEAHDYVQASTIYRLDTLFHIIDSFNVGVNCNQIFH